MRNIPSTFSSSACLWTVKIGHIRKKCFVSSIPERQEQISLGVSRKLCLFLWCLSGLSPILSWKMILVIRGLWIPKIDLGSGRINDRMCFFSTSKVGNSSKAEIMLFHKTIASGKKLLRNFVVRHLNV